MKTNLKTKLIIILILLIILSGGIFYYFGRTFKSNISDNIITVHQTDSPIDFAIDKDFLSYDIKIDRTGESFESNIAISTLLDPENRISLSFSKYENKNASCVTGGCGGLESESHDKSMVRILNTINNVEIGRLVNSKNFEDDPQNSYQILLGKVVSIDSEKSFIMQEFKTDDFDKVTIVYSFSKKFDLENPDLDTQKIINKFDDVIRSIKINQDFPKNTK